MSQYLYFFVGDGFRVGCDGGDGALDFVLVRMTHPTGVKYLEITWRNVVRTAHPTLGRDIFLL